MQQPEYACGLIRDAAGNLLLQLRPPTARHAANLLTCFGGAREAGETALDCLARELQEELDWNPPRPDARPVHLFDGERWIAAFYPMQLDQGITLTTEPGFGLVRAPLQALPGLPLSPWHALVITGWQRGAGEVNVAEGLLETGHDCQDQSRRRK